MKINVEPHIVSAGTTTLFESADAAWRGALSSIVFDGEHVDAVRDPLSIGSHFGSRARPTRELLATQFGIANPRKRIISSVHRHFDLTHAVGQLFWILCGSDDVNSISFYNKFGARLSDDGLTLFAAPGARIFVTPQGDQFESAITRLERDASSRRAVIQLFTPADAIAASRDISCFLSVQLLIREGTLRAIGLMRSQSVAMVMPHDLFLLLMLQEMIAARLGLELGSYQHWASSMHIYEDELVLAQKIVREPVHAAIAMSQMPVLRRDWRKALVSAEGDIRARLSKDIEGDIVLSRYGVEPYWESLLAILVAGARTEHGRIPQPNELDLIDPDLRPLIRSQKMNH